MVRLTFFFRWLPQKTKIETSTFRQLLRRNNTEESAVLNWRKNWFFPFSGKIKDCCINLLLDDCIIKTLEPKCGRERAMSWMESSHRTWFERDCRNYSKLRCLGKRRTKPSKKRRHSCFPETDIFSSHFIFFSIHQLLSFVRFLRAMRDGSSQRHGTL